MRDDSVGDLVVNRVDHLEFTEFFMFYLLYLEKLPAPNSVAS